MTQTVNGQASGKVSWLDAFLIYFRPRPFLMLLLGFSAGLPFLLTGGTLGIWLRETGVDRSTIGFLSWVGFAYSAKPLWSPVVDQVPIPILETVFGRRRAWMLVVQVALIVALIGFAFSAPGPANLGPMIFFALLVAFLSATQDIVIDAWRIEAAHEEEQGAMAGAYQLGYRIALFTAGAGALYIADFFSWKVAYLAMAAAMGVGIVATLFATRAGDRPVSGIAVRAPATLGERISRGWQSFYDAAAGPFIDFFKRQGWAPALIILGLIGAYTLTDRVMGVMAGVFYTDMGFTKSEIATVSKVYGIWIGIAGALLAGVVIAQIGTFPSLVIGAIVAAASNLAYVWLETQGHSLTALTVTISIENLSGGFAGTTLIAYMSGLTSTAYTATQYALFSSFSSLPGKFLGGLSGVMVDMSSWMAFFIMTALMGLPAVILAFHLWAEALAKKPGAASA